MRKRIQACAVGLFMLMVYCAWFPEISFAASQNCEIKAGELARVGFNTQKHVFVIRAVSGTTNEIWHSICHPETGTVCREYHVMVLSAFLDQKKLLLTYPESYDCNKNWGGGAFLKGTAEQVYIYK